MKHSLLFLSILMLMFILPACQKNAVEGANARVSFILQSPDGAPLSKVAVDLRTSSGKLLSSELTDSVGKIEVEVPANEDIEVQVNDPCGHTVYSGTISHSDQGNKPGIVKASQNESFQSIKGKLLDCEGRAISNGYASISVNGMLRYAPTDQNGDFSVTFVGCKGSSGKAYVFGVNELSLQKSQVMTLPILSAETTTGNIKVCGASVEQYVRYSIDGVNTELLRNVSKNDSIGGYNTIIAGERLDYLSAGKSKNDEIFFSFSTSGASAEGSYPLGTLLLGGHREIEIIRPFEIKYTSYPKNPGAFYEGTLSGKFNSNGTKTIHEITASFKIMRIN